MQQIIANPRDCRLMLFDLALEGHHGNYIKHLIDYWCQHNLPGNLDIVVLPEFLQIHTEVVETISKYKHSKIKLLAITAAETKALNSSKSILSRIKRNLQEWELYRQYAKSLQATHSLIMYLDTSEIPLSLGKQSPCPFSGIYFRPTFHYDSFSNYQPVWQDRLQQARERLTLSRILAHPQLKNIFCLDPFAIKYIKQFKSQVEVVYLPDPVKVEQFFDSDLCLIEPELKIESNRKVFLLFGAMSGRKGIYPLLDAVAELPSDICQTICLLLVGKTNAADRAKIEHRLQAIKKAKPVQTIARYDFVPESNISCYFQIADVILAPYQKHVGMSGILLMAAAAGKPVLSSNYGLMGEIVRRNKLGLTIDSTRPSKIAQGLIQCLQQSFSQLGDRSKMYDFAQQNSTENYAQAIFNHLAY